MKRNVKNRLPVGLRLLVVLTLGLIMAAAPPPAEAQFLKKLSKGLEKINQGLESVEKMTKEKKKKADKAKSSDSKKQSSEKKSAQQSASSGNTAADQRNTIAESQKKGEWKPQRVFLTNKTRFIKKKVNINALKPVSEGIFALPEYNRSIGYGSYWGFWTVDGESIFPAIYEQFGEMPRFDSDACVVKKAEQRQHSPMILYADGSTRELSHEWNNMTQFYDGVAMVREMIAYRTTNLFYVNTKGEKIWPHLAENNAKGSIAIKMRYEREGLRAFYSNAAKAWGFVDSKGNVVIKPQFFETRDFVNGYALVIIAQNTYGGYPAFIDRQGNVVCKIEDSKETTLQYSTNISDVCDGIFRVDRGEKGCTYYNIAGEALKTFPALGSQFYRGIASVKNERYGETDINLIDRNMNVIGQWPFRTSEFHEGDCPNFETFPLYTFDDAMAIDRFGQPQVMVASSYSADNILGAYSADGYAPVKVTYKDPNDASKSYVYLGYADASGMLTVVFCEDEAAAGPFENRLPGPFPIRPIIIDSIPRDPPRLPPGDTIPRGPRVGANTPVLYNVNVKAYPAEGGTVYGSGKYAYGDTIRVTGTVNKGWKLSTVYTSRPTSQTDVFNRFVVKGDMDITCYFIKEEDITDAGNGTFSGVMPQMGLQTYLQLGKTSDNRYTQKTDGYLAVLLPEHVGGTGREGKTGASVNLFFVPSNVLGMVEENGKKYLRFDGGVLQYGNLKLSDNVLPINNILLSLMLAFDNGDSGELAPGSYRVEITSGSPEDGEFTLGRMERLSPLYGWLSSDDSSFERRIPGFFLRRVDKGLSADFLQGVTLSTAPKQTVQWEPSPGFYGENDGRLKNVVRRIGEIYRGAVAGTPLSDYDMQQFSSDLDKHVFKMK